jgi:hypothetical protein
MSEFTFLFRGRERSASPAEMQKNMEKWLVWFKELNAKGLMKDPGNPLADSGKVIRGRHKIVSDGPYAEAKDVVGGYIVIEAETLAEATDIAKSCPILDVGGSVEVRPVEIVSRQ